MTDKEINNLGLRASKRLRPFVEIWGSRYRFEVYNWDYKNGWYRLYLYPGNNTVRVGRKQLRKHLEKGMAVIHIPKRFAAHIYITSINGKPYASCTIAAKPRQKRRCLSFENPDFF